MKKDEIAMKNISLVFDFLKYLTEHPELVENLPDQGELEFFEKDFPLTETEAGTQATEKAFLKVERTFTLATDMSG